MDDKWFKKQQKRVGVTADVIAKKMGRDRSAVSHIYTGQRKMSLDWAQVFSDVLEVPLDEVLKRAGVINEAPAKEISRSFTDGDITLWTPANGRNDYEAKILAKHLGGDKPGIDVWEVSNNAMQLGGYLPGDHIVVNSQQSELCKAGDVVIAQRHDGKSGKSSMILRRFEPPVLVSASPNPLEQRVYVVDGDNVAIMGKVIASWRN